MPKKAKIKKPKLPALLDRKLQKTGQTRGADDDEIYQNRVGRSNTVLIPFHQWQHNEELRAHSEQFEMGYIVLIAPVDYFSHENDTDYLRSYHLELGVNCLVFYETRADWEKYSPIMRGWHFATDRRAPLGGQYVARVPANTSADEEHAQKVNECYATQNPKGAGIRLYEYASKETIQQTKLQLEAEYWLCRDAVEVAAHNGMTEGNALLRKNLTLSECEEKGLLDYQKLKEMRIINQQNHTVCPLCLKELSGEEFLNRLAQPEGREVPDLTVTQVNLFHIEELKFGAFNHRPYNLGWGHHFCNVVVKDSGIYPTLDWMQDVIRTNKELGYIEN